MVAFRLDVVVSYAAGDKEGVGEAAKKALSPLGLSDDERCERFLFLLLAFASLAGFLFRFHLVRDIDHLMQSLQDFHLVQEWMVLPSEIKTPCVHNKAQQGGVGCGLLQQPHQVGVERVETLAQLRLQSRTAGFRVGEVVTPTRCTIFGSGGLGCGVGGGDAAETAQGRTQDSQDILFHRQHLDGPQQILEHPEGLNPPSGCLTSASQRFEWRRVGVDLGIAHKKLK